MDLNVCFFQMSKVYFLVQDKVIIMETSCFNKKKLVKAGFKEMSTKETIFSF